MKTCSKCKQQKAYTCFNKRTNAADGHQHHCRDCEKKNHRHHYNKNKAIYVDRAKTNTARYVKEYQEWRKNLACQTCSETDSVCIDLHHLDSTKKDFNIGDKASRSGLIKQVREEIKKCAIVCSNCHRKIHKYGNEWYYSKVAERLGDGLQIHSMQV